MLFHISLVRSFDFTILPSTQIYSGMLCSCIESNINRLTFKILNVECCILHGTLYQMKKKHNKFHKNGKSNKKRSQREKFPLFSNDGLVIKPSFFSKKKTTLERDGNFFLLVFIVSGQSIKKFFNSDCNIGKRRKSNQ